MATLLVRPTERTGSPASELPRQRKSVPDGRNAEAQRRPVEHRVKSWPRLFQATLSGAKVHDMRRATDRDYRTGDTLLMQEFDPAAGTYTGRSLRAEITYVTSTEAPCALSGEGLHPDFCILSLALRP